MKRNHVFPTIVLLFSVFEIVQSVIGAPNWLGLLNSAIGIVGAAFFFLKNESYRKAIDTWIYLQAVVITKTVMGVEEPILDLTQFFVLKLGFLLSFDETSYSLDFNFLAPIYFIAFRKLQISELIGTQLNLKLYRENELLSPVLPQEVSVIDKINFSSNEDWLLVRLSKPIQCNPGTCEYGLIKSKDGIPIVPAKKGQMAHLRVVKDPGLVRGTHLDSHVFVDWVFVS